MPTLIENILSLEAKANEMVANAHGDAEAIAKRADDEIAAAGTKLVAKTDAKRAALEEATEERCKRDLADVESQFQAERAALDGITSTAIQQHAAKIAAAFTQG
jgi:flagellar biosynthesis/type III secretory pathway protein FliH